MLRGAWRAGVVHAAAQPATVGELATATGLAANGVGDVARALEAIEVFDRSGDDPLTYVVAPGWQPLLLTEPPLPLEQVLDFCSARIGMISAIVADDEDYWQVDDEARLAYAVGVAVDPTTPNAANLLGPVLASYAEQHEQFQRGGRYLELGCGAAGMCNTILQIYPALEAVGIELSDVLTAKARERAEAVGVADRFTVVCGDVRDFDEPDSFDSVFWSQSCRTDVRPRSCRARKLGCAGARGRRPRGRAGRSRVRRHGVPGRGVRADRGGAEAEPANVLVDVVLRRLGVTQAAQEVGVVVRCDDSRFRLRLRGDLDRVGAVGATEHEPAHGSEDRHEHEERPDPTGELADLRRVGQRDLDPAVDSQDDHQHVGEKPHGCRPPLVVPSLDAQPRARSRTPTESSVRTV